MEGHTDGRTDSPVTMSPLGNFVNRGDNKVIASTELLTEGHHQHWILLDNIVNLNKGGRSCLVENVLFPNNKDNGYNRYFITIQNTQQNSIEFSKF